MVQINLNIFILLVLQFSVLECARILVVAPTPSISHMVIYHPIIKELSLRGHEVVAILPDPINDSTLTNLTEINVHDTGYQIWVPDNRLAETRIEKESCFTSFSKLYKTLLKVCDAELSHPQVQDLIKNRNMKFDLVINEWLMYASTFAFGAHFQCPIIGISSMPLFITGYDTIGVPTHPAYALDFFKLSGNDLTFWQRLDNTFYSIWFRLYYHFIVLPDHDRIAKKYFGNNLKYIGEIENDVQLVLVNTNPAFHINRPMPATVIEIGGIHRKEKRPLPKSLRKYLDESSQGVIYFSLGSNVKSTSLSKDVIDLFYQVFLKLPFNVLWKWESDQKPFILKNVRMEQWFPQQDVLEHKNVKMFITQGGLQSIEESISSRVPMLGIPFAGDQDYNVARIVTLKIGNRINLEDITIDLLNQTIYDVITNLNYKKNIEEISEILWDQITPPLDRAIWWIEYVLRHKGATALKSGHVLVPWYQFLLLDILAFFIVCFIIVFICIKMCIRIICQFLIRRKQKND